MRQPRVPAPRRHDPAHSSGRSRRDMRALLAVSLLTGSLACAATNPPTSPGSPPAHRNNAERPPPFAVAPEFTVADATGTPRTLASLMGPKGLVLVLYRGHW